MKEIKYDKNNVINRCEAERGREGGEKYCGVSEKKTYIYFFLRQENVRKKKIWKKRYESKREEIKCIVRETKKKKKETKV